MPSRAAADNSSFYMWRALFAFALTDDKMSTNEKDLLKSYWSGVAFTPDQMEILRQDFITPPDVIEMYNKMTSTEDKIRFCTLARALMWNDGNFDRQEAEILRRVSCLRSCEGRELLKQSRTPAHLHAYYDCYRDAGTAGLFSHLQTFRMSA